uniref:LOW QUALITY PROTEIN: zinc finger protein Rlf-like n=1 Tax=Oncorhynchus gorbuscha TaxID=8017 RepID=UPI001EAEBDB8|nr:LOW QUALITY PROTEIN: zinc finger protein Rlf-like [Oncorhynchus gorbuscha]
MADSDVEPAPDWSNRLSNTAEDTFVDMEGMLTTLRALEVTLWQQDISEISSTEYCDNFCQALMHYAGSRNSVEHGLPLLEVYCLSINCFAAARPHLTADSDNVGLVLKRLALSCFELLLSVPENEIHYEAWVQFYRSVQVAHDALLEYGSTDLQALLQITGEGGVWSNPVLGALLTGRPTNIEEVEAYIALEGEGFMERVKHLEKVGEVAKAVVLAKSCAECHLVSNQTTFRQTYVSLLCHLLPGEEAIMEISRLDCKDVLDITCSLETEGEENTAFILCTTFLTQQLQQQRLYCSWELTLLWSKLQRRIDPSLESLLERCLQLGAIAKTVYHLLFLVHVIRTEAEVLGLASSVELCVKALQLPDQEDTETRISVCKTVACLLPDDLEVLRACQLTEFLLGLSHVAFSSLEELSLQTDQKYDQENSIIPNSLRCELLLALKAHWSFDPEFWDWKTLKHQCIRLLGLDPEPEEDEDEGGQEISLGQDVKEEVERGFVDMPREYINRTIVGIDGHNKDEENEWDSKPPLKPDVEQGSLQKKYKFLCKICKKSVTETRILLHSKRHENNGVFTCPVCLKKFKSRKDFVPHTKLHLRMPPRSTQQKRKDKKRIDWDKEMEEDDLETVEIALDPSLMLYYQSTHDPDVLEHILEQASSAPRYPGLEDNVTFDYINFHFELQNHDIYTCPATHCTKTFKHSKYLGVHLRSEYHVGDQNVKHYFEMKDRREKCTYCRRHFMSAYHHRRHQRLHYGDLPYICMVTGCGARFSTSNKLVAHKHRHGYQVSYQCELKGCCLSFSDLGQVYHHEAQHFRDAAYSCTILECKKFYFSKKEFSRHLATHGITFSEEDFEAQRKAKIKHLDSITEDIARPKKYCKRKTVLEEVVIGGNNATSYTCSASSSHVSSCKEPKGTMTSVAVCFDGKKFTCGFERCGLTFSKARDVHKHLRCIHPEHFKAENKELNLDKEVGLKSKGLKVKTEQDNDGQNKHEHAACLLMKGSSQGNACPSLTKNTTTSPSCLANDNDHLREILIGLSQLSLTPSNSTNGYTEPSHPMSVSTTSNISCLTHRLSEAVVEKMSWSKKSTVSFIQNSQTLTWQHPSWQQKYLKNKIMWRRQNVVQFAKSGDKSTKWSHAPSSVQDHFEEESEDGDMQRESGSIYMCKHKDCGMLFCHTYSLYRHKKKHHSQVMRSPSMLSEDPVLQKFRCSYANCNASYLLNSSLVRHLESEHPYQVNRSLKSYPYQATMYCKYEGCTQVFTQSSSLKKHVLSSHLNYYDSLVLHLQNNHNDTSVTGCQKKFIFTSSTPQKDATKLPLGQSLRHCPKSPEDVKAEETSEEHDEDDGEILNVDQSIVESKSKHKFEDMVFRSHEEALQMCRDRCQREAYPCMVQGCDSVVKFIRSMRRHYLNCHKLTNRAFNLNEDKLVFRAEQLEELIQRNTVLSVWPDMKRAPNGVRKMEYQAEPENPGGPSMPMSLYSIKAETLDDYDPLGFKEEPTAERNVLVGADDLLYGEPCGHTEDPATQNSHSQEARRRSSNPPALDLSPPSSLRFCVDESFLDSSGKDGGKPTNISVPLPSPQARQPLKCKNELPEHPPISKDPQPQSPTPRTFDLATYKPMGFESSFLKFIQENSKDKDAGRPRASHCNNPRPDPPVVSARWRDSYRRSCFVKENSQVGLTTTCSRLAHSSPLKPLPRTGEYTSVQNLHVILEKALTGCGDLAIKQLQHQRPVVVLERPRFFTSLLDLFPTNE